MRFLLDPATRLSLQRPSSSSTTTITNCNSSFLIDIENRTNPPETMSFPEQQQQQRHQIPNQSKKPSLYPEVIESNPEAQINRASSSSSPSSNLYPTIDMSDLAENLFPNPVETDPTKPSAPPEAVEEILIKVPGAILHLIDRSCSVELASGDITIIRLIQAGSVVAILASVGEEIQWPLTKDIATVKLDDSHYFFSLNFPPQPDSTTDADVLNYGLTIASKGQDNLLKKLDGVLQQYSCFSIQKVSLEALEGQIAKEMEPAEMKGKKKEVMEERSAAYWTTLAPNVEDYSGTAAKLIAAGSGQLVRGILWCGDVTVGRLKWGNEVLKKRLSHGEKSSEVSPETMKKIKRVKRVTKRTEKMATGVLSGVVKVSGLLTSSVANSKAGKKFFSALPGEVVLASLDGFNKVCDAVEVAGKNVMSTSSTVTTELVSHRYGEEAAEATNEGLGAAGHAIGTAWTVFKIRKALNPKSVLKPTTLAKSAAKAAAAEVKAKKSSK